MLLALLLGGCATLAGSGPKGSHLRGAEPRGLDVELVWFEGSLPDSGWLLETSRTQAQGYVWQRDLLAGDTRRTRYWIRLKKPDEPSQYGGALAKLQTGNRYCLYRPGSERHGMDPDGVITYTIEYDNCAVLVPIR
jgi:hypothetical protein